MAVSLKKSPNSFIRIKKYLRLFSITKFLMICTSVYYIAVVFYIVLSRINYPFELEWMEGGSLIQVVRILSGKMLYVEPSLEFIPFIYSPLYFYVSSFFALLCGPNFFPLRLVSFLSSIGCMVIIFKFVFRETRTIFSGLMAAGFFAATFHLSGAWFDIARVDALFVFFLLWTAYTIYDLDEKKSILASVLVFCTLFTKQTGFIALIPFFMYVFLVNRKSFIYLFSISLLLTGGISLIWNVISDGWFKYFLFSLPRNHNAAINPGSVERLFKIIKPVYIAVAMNLIFITRVRNLPLIKKLFYNHIALYYLFITAGLVGISCAGIINPGSYLNVLLPVYAWIAVIFGLGLNKIIEFTEIKKMYLLNLLISGLVLYQMYLINFPISVNIPTDKDRKAGNLLVDRIKNSRGDVFIPSSNYLAFLAGKKTYLSTIALDEIIGRYGPTISNQSRVIKTEIHTAMEQRIFSLAILDSKDTFHAGDLGTRYIQIADLFEDSDVFFPVTGWKNRPETVFAPTSP